ncbi:MAG: trimethylamine methyltransferase family protein [Alphaproteobacteria bacterium]
MVEGKTSSRNSSRSGGRAARVAMRAAPLSEEKRPVRPGLEGGRYKPLSDFDIKKIHESAVQCLSEIGMADAPQSGVDVMVEAGAEFRDGRLYYSKDMIEDMLALANRAPVLFSQDGHNDLHPYGNKVYYGTAGAAVHVVDVETKDYAESTLADLYKAARLTNGLDNVHFFQRPMVCRDLLDNREMDLNTLYACIKGTSKHVGTSFVDPSHARDGLQIMYEVAGGETAFREKPFVSLSCTHVVPPLKFATESCSIMEVALRGGMPILMLSAGQAGATSPASVAGSVVQAVAECLAGIIYVNSIKPGHSAMFGTWPFVSDLRSGAMSGGSGEQALLSAACAQMHHFYGLPGGAAAGMSDSKMPDIQAGYEKGITCVMAGLAGLNLVYESAGMHASLLGFCMESLVIDNDMLGQCMRAVRGLEVTDESISIETMRKVCLEGPGHYLGSSHTMSLMETEYLYPKIANRLSPKEWAEVGKPDIIEDAQNYIRQVMAAPAPSHISDELDKSLKEKWPLKI